MKKSKHISIAVVTILLPFADASGNVSILLTKARALEDANGILVVDGTLGLIVVDTGANGFGALVAGDILSQNSFIGDGDDYIASRVASTTAFGSVLMQLGGITLSVTDPSPLQSGDAFTLMWFPGLMLSDWTISAGQAYGETRSANWILPPDGNDVIGDDVVSAGPANRTVIKRDTNVSDYSSWQSLQFTQAEINNASISGPNADPDGDGFPNLLECVLGGKPWDPNETGSVEVCVHEIAGKNYLAFLIPKISSTEIILEGQGSSDLNFSNEPIAPVSFDSNRNIIIDTQSMSDSSRRFLRLRARQTTTIF